MVVKIQAETPDELHKLLNIQQLIDAKVQGDLSAAAVRVFLANQHTGDLRADAVTAITATATSRLLPPVPPPLYLPPVPQQLYLPQEQPTGYPQPGQGQLLLPAAQPPQTAQNPYTPTLSDYLPTPITPITPTTVLQRSSLEVERRIDKPFRFSGFFILFFLTATGIALGALLKDPGILGKLLNEPPATVGPAAVEVAPVDPASQAVPPAPPLLPVPQVPEVPPASQSVPPQG